MHMRIIVAGLLLTLAGCGEAASRLESSIDVYLDAGSTQCQDDGQTLEEMKSQLGEADIAFANASCGTDGKVYAAMCGSPDGNIGIFEIDPGDLPAARALGFEALANVPEAARVPCSDW